MIMSLGSVRIRNSLAATIDWQEYPAHLPDTQILGIDARLYRRQLTEWAKLMCTSEINFKIINLGCPLYSVQGDEDELTFIVSRWFTFATNHHAGSPGREIS